MRRRSLMMVGLAALSLLLVQTQAGIAGPLELLPADIHCVTEALPELVSGSEEEPESPQADPVNDAHDPVNAGVPPVCFPLESLAEAASLAGNRTVISIHFAKANFSGSTLRVYVTNQVGCFTGRSYENRTLPSEWNNEISSTETWGGCDTQPHYKYKNFGQHLITCQCATMGAANNETSSVKYKP
ncbi:MAG: hypothetical protein ACRDLB_12685 [Actinomycetota bacterium]